MDHLFLFLHSSIFSPVLSSFETEAERIWFCDNGSSHKIRRRCAEVSPSWPVCWDSPQPGRGFQDHGGEPATLCHSPWRVQISLDRSSAWIHADAWESFLHSPLPHSLSLSSRAWIASEPRTISSEICNDGGEVWRSKVLSEEAIMQCI